MRSRKPRGRRRRRKKKKSAKKEKEKKKQMLCGWLTGQRASEELEGEKKTPDIPDLVPEEEKRSVALCQTLKTGDAGERENARQC